MLPQPSKTQPWISTPPSSSFSGEDELLPTIPTDDLGMVADDGREDGTSGGARVRQDRRRPKKRVSKRLGEPTSKHFRVRERTVATPPPTPSKPLVTRDLNNLHLSSDSSLTEVPSDIGSDPFCSDAAVLATSKTTKTKRPIKSPYFSRQPQPNITSCLPFPSLSARKFGLMQERLAHDPFRLLIATVFLNRTRGEHAMPVFCQLTGIYPTVADLAHADHEEVVRIIHKLGFQNQRARKCIEIAKAWQKHPPEKNRRHRKLNYPIKGDGRDMQQVEIIDDGDGRVAWEISYLPGLGPYSHDSWRIFCRDQLRGLSQSWNGEGAEPGFEPEWKRVLPTDKELRAYLTWMWMKEGWIWNKETGERTKLDEETLARARDGGIVLEEQGKDHLVVTAQPRLDKFTKSSC